MPSFDSKPYFMMERSATCKSANMKMFFPSKEDSFDDLVIDGTTISVLKATKKVLSDPDQSVTCHLSPVTCHTVLTDDLQELRSSISKLYHYKIIYS